MNMDDERKNQIVNDSEAGHEPASIELANALGPSQQLDRNFNLLSISAVGIVTGNTWAALGGSIVSQSSGRNYKDDVSTRTGGLHKG